jgi:hypothetical protein
VVGRARLPKDLSTIAKGTWVPALFRSRCRLARRAGPGTSHARGSDVVQVGAGQHPARIHADSGNPHPGPGSARESASPNKERRNPSPFAIVLRSFGSLALPANHSITPLHRSPQTIRNPRTCTTPRTVHHVDPNPPTVLWLAHCIMLAPNERPLTNLKLRFIQLS